MIFLKRVINTLNSTNIKTIQKFLSILFVVLMALPMTAQESKTIKRKVAIGRFSNETQYAKGLFYDKEIIAEDKEVVTYIK